MKIKVGLAEGLLGFLIWAGVVSAQGIGELIREYEKAAELSRKTKKESLGHLILFTRKDLDVLQARKLSDVLKHIRLFTVSSNRFGVLGFNEFGTLTQIPKQVRLYINDHEVSSLHTGSPFLVWENLPLDQVEHIEIYQSPGAIELGNDPSTVIIKIYTKKPERENASRIVATASSRRGIEGIFYRAVEVSSDFSYIFFVSGGYDPRERFKLGGETLSRDSDYRYAFLGMYFENTSLELGYGFIRRDPFMGFAMDGSAEAGFTEAQDFYLVLTSYPFYDRETKIVLSLDNHRREHYERSDGGLYIPIFMSPNPLNNPEDFYENAVFDKADLYISKTFNFPKMNLLSALSYKLYSANILERRYRTIGGSVVDVDGTVPFNRQEIFSIIVENKLSLTPRNLIITGVKLDAYNRNGGVRNFREWIARVGFISLPTDRLALKTFVSRSYIPPFFYDIEVSKRDLDTVKIPISITAEGSINLEAVKFTLWGGYMRVEDEIIPDSGGILHNSSQAVNYRFASLEAVLSPTGNISLSGGYSFLIDPQKKESPTSGGYLRATSSIGPLSAFSELVYRNSFTYGGKRIGDGYDLSAGISYSITRDLQVRLRGENLLNTSTQIPYRIFQPAGVVSFPVRSRTVYASVDWVF